MADQAADTEVGSPPPDVLEVGPARVEPRKLIILAVVLAVLVGGGFAAWRLWPRPPEIMSADELAGVYAGMVRSDGTNDAQAVPPASSDLSTVVPEACRPLLAMSHSGLVPPAVDGVGTYWIQPDPTSMTTHRFADRRGAEQLIETLSSALTTCSASDVSVRSSEFGGSGRFTALSIADPAADTRQVGYLWTSRGSNGFNQPATAQFVFRVIGFENTVTVVYRYDFSGRPYDSLREDRVTTSLLTQMRAVLALRAK